MKDVLEVLEKHPSIYDLQSEIVRNEGYVKSINGEIGCE